MYQILRENIKQVAYTKNDFILSTPIMHSVSDTTDFESFKSILAEVPYPLYCIHFINTSKNRYTHYVFKHNIQTISRKQETAILNLKPKIQNDIYEVYSMPNLEGESVSVSGSGSKLDLNDNRYLGLAHIPDYKTSVYMNSIFRNIKENVNLDYLEESDDEDDFENIDEDKYVNLDQCYKFECAFNNKFNMWTPIKQVA
jgi:hypothetical protein